MTEHILTEHQEQALVHQWLSAKGIPHFAVPNGAQLGGHRYAQLQKLRAEGFTEGAPDLVIVRKARDRECLDCAGLPVGCPVAVEMKRLKGGRLSADQKRVHEVMRREGWIVLVCKGHKDAIAQLESLGF